MYIACVNIIGGRDTVTAIFGGGDGERIIIKYYTPSIKIISTAL